MTFNPRPRAAGRVNAQRPAAVVREVPQEAAVVAGHLDREVLGVAGEPVQQQLCTAAVVLQLGGRTAGVEAVVAAVDLGVGYDLHQLDEAAVAAHAQLQRVPGFLLVEAGRVGVGQRRFAEVEEHVQLRAGAGAASEALHAAHFPANIRSDSMNRASISGDFHPTVVWWCVPTSTTTTRLPPARACRHTSSQPDRKSVYRSSQRRFSTAHGENTTIEPSSMSTSPARRPKSSRPESVIWWPIGLWSHQRSAGPPPATPTSATSSSSAARNLNSAAGSVISRSSWSRMTASMPLPL